MQQKCVEHCNFAIFPPGHVDLRAQSHKANSCLHDLTLITGPESAVSREILDQNQRSALTAGASDPSKN